MSAPHDWEKGRLGEQCSIEIGGTPSRTVQDYWDNAKETVNTWVSIRDLNRRVITNTAEHISDLGVKRSNVKLQLEGTVLLSFKLSIGRVAFAGLPLYTNEAIAGLRSDVIRHDFLYYGLQQWDLLQGVDQAIKGTTLNKAKLKNIEFTFPSFKPEQAKIAEVLSTVDRAIEQTEALIAKHRRIKAGLMQDLLTRGIDEHGNLRNERTHAFKDSPLGRIPVEWEIVTLNHCVRSDSPICYGILMPGTGYDNGIPVIKVKDVFGGRILQDNLLLTDPKIDRQYARSRLKTGDLLITIRGTTGRVALVPSQLDCANITQDTARLRLKDQYSNTFFFFLLQAKVIQDQVVLHTLGQAVKEINIGEIRKISFALPGVKEQEEIAGRLGKIEETVGLDESKLGKLRKQKTALMQDLLTGNKRVTSLLKSEGDAS
ncbi:MAG: restriction endonuclease subunit S [Candidatus Ozemobacteraceae bacterium]